MLSSPPEELLPVLVADLADEEAFDLLEAAAFAGSPIFVPLDNAPVNTSQHVLEVHIPGRPEPLNYLAEPLGPPTDDGFPLRIMPMPDAVRAPSRSEGPMPAAVVRSRQASVGRILSASHTADLSHAGPMPTAPEDPLLGRALAGGKLTIEQLIGRGGVGAVYKARHRELRTAVAVKVLHESFQHDIDFCRRFYAEALAASQLDHPNITRVLDFGQEPDGLLYLAMEFLAGVELRAVLEKERVLPAMRIAEVMMQTCAGLSHAHARGIIHRDIKPENLVMVPGQDDDGEALEIVKVCDFGIAQHRALPTRVDAGVIAGTPEYMSPEQCRGDELDARSDVYACGVVLYELATGQVPFTAERVESILNKQQFTPPVPPSKIRQDLDPLLERIILKALAKEPEDRPQNMRELRAELREVLSPVMLEASPPPASVRAVMVPTPFAEFPPLVVPRAGAPGRPPPLPMRPQVATAPEWLERGAGTGPVSTRDAPSAAAALDEIAEALVNNSSAWLRSFTQISDPRAFAQFAQRLARSVRALAAAGETRALWAVWTALQSIAMEGTQATGSRAHVSAAVLRVFDDPAILSLVAEQVLTGTDDTRDHAKRLLVNAGVAGAYGAYGARVKLAHEPAIRAAFTAVLKEFGPKAWPVVRAALEKILASDQVANARTMELAEDLLLAVPAVGDESAGHLVVKYLRVNVPGVCRAATASIVTMWSDRAKPLLVGMLQSKDDAVRIAGIAGLRQLGGIDEHVIPRLQAILLRRVPAGDELRAAAAVALSHTAPTAIAPAVSLLMQLMAPPREPPSEPRPPVAPGKGLSREDAVSIAIARSLLTIGGKTYRNLVVERAERSPEPLRTQLKNLVS